MKRMHIAIWSLLACAITINLAYAAPPDGKGPDKDKEPPGQARKESTPPGQQDRTPPGQERAQEQAQARQEQAQERAAEAAANRVEARTQQAEAKAERAERAEIRNPHVDAIDRSHVAEAKVERQHPDQERKHLKAIDRAEGANRKETTRLAQLPQQVHGSRPDRALGGREAPKNHIDTLLKSLNKLEHGRWAYNPHDTRGQGNMGQPRMRDPFGFDKDSGREKSERGRPIRDEESTPASTVPVLNLEQLVSINFQITDSWSTQVQTALAWFYQNNTAGQYDTSIKFMEDYLARLNTLGSNGAVLIRTNFPDTVNYTLTLGTQAGLEGTNLVVTTSLVSVNNYDYTLWTFNTQTNQFESTVIHYDAGQVVVQDTQQLTIGQNSTYTYSYDAPDGLVGYYENGNLFQLAVTVTEPVSGTSYTTTYDRQIYYYRCPYGIIYDKTTGKAIAGATVTVHNADGSIAVLDKGANPNVFNPQTTDATGRYNCKLAIGKKYYLTVKAPGYADYRSGLFSERWHIVREDVGLTKAQAEEPREAAVPSIPITAGTEPVAGASRIPSVGISLPAGQ